MVKSIFRCVMAVSYGHNACVTKQGVEFLDVQGEGSPGVGKHDR